MKKKPDRIPEPSKAIFDPFFEWLEGDDGQTAMEAIDEVSEALEGAAVDTEKKVIIWPDGKRLSIDETARRIQEKSRLDLEPIISHLIGWLEMHYVPKGLNKEDMKVFECQVGEWIEEYTNTNLE